MKARRIAGIVALGAGLMLIATACSDVSVRFGHDEIEGSGKVVAETRDVSSFERIVLAGEGVVVVEHAATPSLVIETDDNLLGYIDSNIHGSTLTLSIDGGIDLDPTDSVRYRIGVPELTAVELSGAGTIELPEWEAPSFEVLLSGAGNVRVTDLQADNLDVRFPGVGTISISGRVDTQTVNVSGTGRYDGAWLRTDHTEIRSTGVGGATIWAEESLDVRSSGVGGVSYYGSPELSQTVTGLGTIQSLGAR